MADEVEKKTVEVIATARLVGDWGVIEEGATIPKRHKSIPLKLVKQWMKDGVATVKGGEGDIGHWNDEDPMSGLPEEAF